uniref:Sugar phosphate transporter domain-containing protein n=1 Tax=Amorphochlora amoebiformis TaxID=1561963 RepID=A0A7S0CR38_9EUKA|mmetsp:Transcript_12030/g.19123  ORF Transcript_12030/g.19123 Transcript_12030/m.19123 type:complete len:397 (+) Transcript_12030:26-1216(+)
MAPQPDCSGQNEPLLGEHRSGSGMSPKIQAGLRRGETPESPRGGKASTSAVVVLIIVFLCSDSAITILLKWLMDGPLRTPALMTVVSQALSFIMGLVATGCLPSSIYKAPEFAFDAQDWFAVVVLSLGYCMNVGCRNIAFIYFSLALVQLIRGLIPLIVWVLSSYFLHRRLNKWQLMSLFILVCGICLGAGGSADFSIGPGFALALCSATGSAIMIVSSGFLVLRRPSVNVLDIVILQAPIPMVIMSIVGYFIGDFQRLEESINLEGLSFVVGIFVLVGTMAFFFNVIVYLIIKWTSSIYYSVAGGFRYCLIMALSYVFFNQSSNVLEICGIVIACIGFLSNSMAEMSPNSRKYAKSIRPPSFSPHPFSSSSPSAFIDTDIESAQHSIIDPSSPDQ